MYIQINKPKEHKNITVMGQHLARQLPLIQRKGGSHGKKLKLNVKGTFDRGYGDEEFNDRKEDVSIVKGHGGYTDKYALAEAWVRKAYGLSAEDSVTIEEFNFYTAK